jgi:hypothetical protein
MLDRPIKQTPFRKSFDEWWSSMTPEFESRIDPHAAWTIFQAGYTAGHRKDVRRYIFKARRFRITVWAQTTAEAKNLAEKEADRRAAAKGWEIPQGGWQLEQFS